MGKLIAEVKAEGNTIGGIIACVIQGCPVGLGEPVFDKLHAQLGAAMLSINAAKGFEYGKGFAGVTDRVVLKTITSFPTETEALPLLPTTAEAYKGASATDATFTSA